MAGLGGPVAKPAPNALAKLMATGKYSQPGRTISGGATDPNALGKLWSSGQYSAPTGGKGFVSSPGIKQAAPQGDPYANAINSGDPSALSALGKALAGNAPPAQPPLDSTYAANVANNQFKTNNAINAENRASGYAKTDLATQLGTLAQKQPLDTEKARESYNNQGLLYSGHLGQALGQLGQSYADRQAALQSNYDRGQAARDARVAALQQGEPLYEQGQAAASTGRATAAAAADKTLGVPATPSPGASTQFGGQGGPSFGPGGGFKVIPGTQGSAVIGSGGRIVPLGPAVGPGGGFRLVPGSRTHVVGAGGKVIPIAQAHLSSQQLHTLLGR